MAWGYCFGYTVWACYSRFLLNVKCLGLLGFGLIQDLRLYREIAYSWSQALKLLKVCALGFGIVHGFGSGAAWGFRF